MRHLHSALLRQGLSAAALVLLAACAHSAPAPAAPPGPAPAAPIPAVAPAPAAPPAPAPPPAPARRVLPGEDVLEKQPQPPPLKPFDAPVPQVTPLPNGLRLYVVERPGDGIETLELVIRRGSAVDPPKLPGLASLTAAMLETGSAGRTQSEMARAVEALGAELHVGAAEDETIISLSAMPSRLETMASLLADVALRPNLDLHEWARLKGQREAELIADRSQPVVASTLAFGAAVYGEYPLGRPTRGTLDSVKRMTLYDVQAFFRTFSPREAAIVAVGGARSAGVVAALTRAFAGWQAGKAARTTAQVLASARLPGERPRLVMVDFPGKPQSVLRVGQPAVPRSSPDYLALRLLNAILGGSFTSRLNQNLREQHGYSYGAGSAFAFGAGPGPFCATSSVKTEVTGPALAEMLRELERATREPLSPEELEKGKALLAFDLTQELEHATTAAEVVAQLFLYELPLDELRRFVPRLQALTAEEVQAAARRVLAPEQMTIVVVGDAAKVASQLKELRLPPAQPRNAEGERLPER